MTNIFFRFWQVGSFVFLIGIFFFCYLNFPESIAINFNEMGEPISFIDKQHYFYWAAGLILGVNFFLNLLGKTIQKLDFSTLFNGMLHNESAKTFLDGWFSALITFINGYLIFVLLGLNNINSTGDQMLDFNYNYLLWVGILGLLIILIFLPYKLLSMTKANGN